MNNTFKVGTSFDEAEKEVINLLVVEMMMAGVYYEYKTAEKRLEEKGHKYGHPI